MGNRSYGIGRHHGYNTGYNTGYKNGWDEGALLFGGLALLGCQLFYLIGKKNLLGRKKK